MFKRSYLIVFFGLFLAAQLAHADGPTMGVGIDGGMSADALLSDGATGIFGLGLGSQYGLFFEIMKDQPMGWKARLEKVYMREEAIGRARTDYITQNSYFKFAEQEYWLFGVGPEWHKQYHGQELFWELQLGYAFGQPSSLQVELYQVQNQLSGPQTTAQSAVYISGGLGFRKKITDALMAVVSLRTLYLFGTAYNSTTLAGKMFVPIPLMGSFGLEYPF